MTVQESLQLMAMIQAAWAQAPLTETQVGVWRSLLTDLPYEPAVAAVRRLAGTMKWRPSIAEIRQAVQGDPRDALPTLDDVVCRVMAFPSGSDGTVLGEVAQRVVRIIGRDRIRFEPTRYIQREAAKYAAEALERLEERVSLGEDVREILELPPPRLQLVQRG